ncbi:MAG TPA: cadmium-translocating P-type ATPase [Candidatus Pelethenecus faecipullorum]|uniref:Cadmium-translocating P-type ATPase n=1 Tax=Candidatus Pelethenecus faecipullorum TaxID=2840900 RepID=A0A9D1GQ76_9MOLU|nr:cadmium-translocating P-type ATPase [Candidatus Pelethenecus faecipullorum]
MSKEKWNLIRIIVSAVVFIPCFILHMLVEMPPYVLLSITLIVYALIGYDIVYKSVRNIFHIRFLDENFLMVIATVGAFIIGEYLEAVAVMIFYQIGELFQSYAVGKSRKSIAALMDIRPEKATILVDGKEKTVDPEEVLEGDILLIKVGEKVPVDGIVLKGKSSLDTKALTGESVPMDVAPQDEVLSGSINLSGVLTIRATKMYFDSTVSKILDLVENAAGKKAQSEAFITKFAKYYTPLVVLAAVLLGVIPPLLDGQWEQWVFRALTFLVVSCPCALVISVPLSFFCGIGGSSKDGILVKGGSYLELMDKANVFVFDKTGTLTKGVFEVVDVKSDLPNDEVLKIAAIAEKNSNHPIAKSILAKVDSVEEGYETEEIAGYGMVARKEDVILVGNAKLMERFDIPYVENDAIGSVVYVAKNQRFIGSIVISDTVKEDAFETMEYLHKNHLKTIMLTGDNEKVAIHVAETLKIQEVHANLLPQNKVALVEQILASKDKKDVVAFVGDGINDAPVLMRADIGISMGGIGSDSAIEASDLVLMYDDLTGIIKAKKMAHKTVTIVWENILFALIVKFSVLILSACGFANMWLAILADVGVAVLAILNAMRCAKTKQ